MRRTRLWFVPAPQIHRLPYIFEFWGANTTVMKYSDDIESWLILLTALCYQCSHTFSQVRVISQSKGKSVKSRVFSPRHSLWCPAASSHVGTHLRHSLTPRKPAGAAKPAQNASYVTRGCCFFFFFSVWWKIKAILNESRVCNWVQDF